VFEMKLHYKKMYDFIHKVLKSKLNYCSVPLHRWLK